MNRLKLIFHIIIHLALLVTSTICNSLSTGLNKVGTISDRLLELNETYTDRLIGE